MVGGVMYSAPPPSFSRRKGKRRRKSPPRTQRHIRRRGRLLSRINPSSRDATGFLRLRRTPPPPARIGLRRASDQGASVPLIAIPRDATSDATLGRIRHFPRLRKSDRATFAEVRNQHSSKSVSELLFSVAGADSSDGYFNVRPITYLTKGGQQKTSENKGRPNATSTNRRQRAALNFR